MIGIYMFTNQKNGKVYVGQSKNIEKRYYQHSINSLNSNCTEYNTYFYKAIRKYGFNNFSFEILEICLIEELDEKEIKWIKEKQANNPAYGYNSTEGGTLPSNRSKTIFQYDMNFNLIKIYKNAYEAAEILGDGYSQSAIQRCATHKKCVKSVGGFIFTYANDDFSYYKETHKKAVIRIDKNGEKREFESIKEAAKQSNTYACNISQVINGKRKSAGGYFWKQKI